MERGCGDPCRGVPLTSLKLLVKFGGILSHSHGWVAIITMHLCSLR